MAGRERRVGLFSTVPVEVLFAANREPVDLNNLFVASQAPGEFLRQSDVLGLAPTLCAWTRGLFGVSVASEFSTVVVVPQGDCSSNVTMAGLLEQRGVQVVEFSYPVGLADATGMLEREIERFAGCFSVPLGRVQEQFERLRPVRELLDRLDRMNWIDRVVPGSVARQYLLQSTDMGGNSALFQRRLESLLGEFEDARPGAGPRMAVFGVPAIIGGLVERLEAGGAGVVLCETESDFAMIPPAASLVDQYLRYAYPYGIEGRLKRFVRLARARGVDGVVVYSQAFCHHNLEMACVESALTEWPTLFLEGDLPQALSPRDAVRLDGFMELFARRRRLPCGGPVCGAASERTGLSLGLDLGSRYAKVAARRDGECRTLAMDTVAFYQKFAERRDNGLAVRIEGLLAHLGLDDRGGEESMRVVSTGYGRNLVRFGNAVTVPEIVAHAAGAARQVSDDHFLLVDLGGQDTKALVVKGGNVETFVMNDKCAAGSGRYVENMAVLLGRTVEDVVGYAADPVALTNVCATFGESEIVGHIVDGVPFERICAGIMQSVAERTSQLIMRLGDAAHDLPLVLAGGLASSQALATFLAKLTGAPRVEALSRPRFNGAFGCLALADSGEVERKTKGERGA